VEGVSRLTKNGSDVLVVIPTLGERLPMLERALGSVTAGSSGVVAHPVVVIPRREKAARRVAIEAGAAIVDDPGKGMSAAINAGLEARSTEPYYLWLGDDDFLEPGGLAALVRLLEANTEATVAYGACRYVDEDNNQVWISRAGPLATLMLGFGPNLIPHPAALMRLDELVAVVAYDEQLKLAMDLDVFLKLKKKGKFVSTREVVSCFGWHPTSLTVQDRQASLQEARVVKRKHLSPGLRRLEPLWEHPVQAMTRVAAHFLSQRRPNESSH